MKRKDYIDWDQYFMGVAKLSALRSKDPNTQVGCCIATPDNRIASLGYNGLPYGLSDDDFTWERRDFWDSLYFTWLFFNTESTSYSIIFIIVSFFIISYYA